MEGKKGGVVAKVVMRRVDAARVDISVVLKRSSDVEQESHLLFSTSID